MEQKRFTFNLLKPTHRISNLLLLVIILALLTLYVLNASRPGQAAEGCPDGCATVAEHTAGPVRVLSLNMLHGFPRFKDLQLRLDLIAAGIKRVDPDAVLLQEVPWTVRTGNGAEYLAQKLGYNYLYYRASGNKSMIFFEEGEAILSRYPLKDAEYTELPPGMGFFEHRVALGSTVDTPWGEVRLFVTHLTNKDPLVGAGQAESLKRFVELYTQGIAVVAGDFNAREDSPQIIELARVWTDAYRAAHPDDGGLTCCIDDLVTGPEEPLEKRIDYIFLVNQNQTIKNTRLVFDQPMLIGDGWQWVSDHIGLMVEFEP